MAKKLYISDSTFNNGSTCTQSYFVEFKLSGATYYTPVGTQLSSPIVVENLDDGEVYDIRITRTCCNGTVSAPVVITMSMTQVSMPENPDPDGVSSSAIDVDWDAPLDPEVPTEYILERGLQADYSDAVQIYKGATTFFADTGLAASTTYYYRVRGVKSGFLASDWLTFNEDTL